jgi:serine/threonine protein kinase
MTNESWAQAVNEGRMWKMQGIEDARFAGRTIDHYVIVALIREGAQGKVYRGRDEVLHREVAIKVMNSGGSSDASSRRGLIAEARALSRLNHPNVADVYDFVTHDQRDYLVMEFIAGATLQEVLACGPLPGPEVLRLGIQLARGVGAIHAANLIHRDIKPANLKLTSTGLLKIVDFGLAEGVTPAALLDSSCTTMLTVVGTLPYMAPEVLWGGRADERSDIFSAGAVLYEMATGCRAFPQRTLPALVEAIDRCDVIGPSRANPTVSLALDRVVMKALRTAPSARYQNAMELADALEALISSPHGAGSDKRHARRWWSLATATRKLLTTT